MGIGVDMIKKCLFLILWAVFVSSSKLNVPRVLLPISPRTPVNFTLEVSDGGCYTWSSSRPEAVKLIPIVDNDECSRKAIVTSAGSFSHKMTAIVLAQEKSSGEIFRCDVIVNHIHSIHIAMKTRELFIEDAPEEFYARASDDQGNEFSSVDGLVFRWNFEGHSTDADSGNEPVLRWVKFADSAYEVLPSIATLETMGHQGHVILIEGVRTGSAKVSVRLEDESFKNVPTVDVNIVVVANLVLDPPEVYVLPGSIVPLRLSQIRQGRAETISFPTSQYYLEADDPKVGAILDNTGSFRALQRGTTNIRLRDRNMKDPDVKHAPHVLVHVVHPHRLSLALLPERSWATVLGRPHAIQVDLFDEHGNYIQPNDDVFVKVNVPTAFSVDLETKNGTYHHGKAVTVGIHKVKASMRLLKMADGSELELSPVLKASADMEIFESVSVIPSRQILAWDPITQPRHEIKYTAAGGAAAHHFASSNTSFAVVSQAGGARTLGMGWCTISAYVPKYPHVRGDAALYVLLALNMSIAPHVVEIEEGNLIHVPVKMTTRLPNGEEAKFHDCTDVTLDIELSDRKNFDIGPLTKDAPKLMGCRSIPVHARGIAVTKLALTFNSEDNVVRDSVILSSYRKLRHLEPSSRETVLALGSSRVLVFEGGPLPWINKPSGHYRKIHVENETVATVGHLTGVKDERHLHKDVYQVEVHCRRIGETEITFRVGNIATATNPNPVQATTQIKVSCAHPTEIYITPEVRLPDDARAPCPLDSSTQRIAAQSYLDLNLVVVVKDNIGRKLDNFSSVQLEWVLSNSELGKLSSKSGVLMDTTKVDGYSVLGRSYQLLKPLAQTGSLDVTAKILGYQQSTLRDLGLASQPVLFEKGAVAAEDDDGDKLSYTVDLELVEDVYVDPRVKSIFNHQKNKLTLRLVEGSGSFHLEYQPKNVARVEYIAINRTLKVVPLAHGELRITVTDLCLWTRQPATSVIQVVGISRVDLQVTDKIEQGKSVPLTVVPYDTLGQQMDASVLPYITLQPVLGSAIVQVKRVRGLEHEVFGATLGETTISFSTSDIRSSLVNVQVFAPLRIHPRNITLILGATLQVMSTGGPQPDAVVEYILENGKVATCTSNGIVEGIRLGHSKLLARAINLDSHTGKKRVFSQDQVDIHVVRLSGVRIKTPLTRVRQNTQMPVYVTGLDENETPFAFGTCHPPLTVEWTLSDHLSGHIFSPFSQSGLHPQLGSNHFAARFHAMQPGHTLLKVKVTSQPASGQLVRQELTDEVSIQVFESLQLTSPYTTFGDVLIMMPNTAIDLRTNLDSSATLEYSVDSPADVVQPDGKGIVRAGASLGHASLITTAANNLGVVQSLSTLVEVRPVSYLMLTASRVLSQAPGFQLAVIPRGFELDMKLTYHDTLGRAFHGVRNQLTFRPSRFDLMRVSFDSENSTLTVHASKVGQTVLHLSDELHPGLGDYLRFDVADVIHPPQADLMLGDVVCFSTPVLPIPGASGKWSSDPKILDVDAESGVALTVGVGATEVAYSISDKQSTSTEVVATAIASMRFEEVAEKSVSDARRGSQVFPISFRQSGQGSLVGDNCSADAVSRFVRHRTLPLTCSLSFTVESELNVDDLFSAKVEFDAKTGFYQCVVKATGSPTAVSSTLDTDIILKAKYSNVLSTQRALSFQPAVFIQTPEIHVSDLQPATHLIITGKASLLRQLELESSDHAALTVYAATHPSPTSIKVPIRFNPGYSGDRMSSLLITVRSPLTGQQTEVAVKVKLFGDQAQCAPDATWMNVLTSFWYFSQERAISVLSLFGTCALIYLGYRALASSTSSRAPQPVVYIPSNPSSESSGYGSPFIKRGPQLWSVDSDSPLHHSGMYPRSPYHSSPNSSSSPLLQRRPSPQF